MIRHEIWNSVIEFERWNYGFHSVTGDASSKSELDELLLQNLLSFDAIGNKTHDVILCIASPKPALVSRQGGEEGCQASVLHIHT